MQTCQNEPGNETPKEALIFESHSKVLRIKRGAARVTKTNKDRPRKVVFSDALVSCRSTGWKKGSDLKRRQRQTKTETETGRKAETRGKSERETGSERQMHEN